MEKSEIWTVQKVLNWTVAYFTSKQIPEPRLSAELLLAQALDCKRIELYLQFERTLSPRELAAYRAGIQRRAQREPVQYILGMSEFMGLPFKVTPAVLIPRPDTEVLVDCAIEYLKRAGIPVPRILDVGAGSGCIAVSLAKSFPAAEVWAVEKSPPALQIARENAAANGVEIRFWETNFFADFPGREAQFHLLVTNPPYVADSDWETLQPEVRRFEPAEALRGGPDGLAFYRQLAPLLPEMLAPGAAAMLETGYNQARAVAALLEEQQLATEIRKDYQQIERVVIGRRGGKDKG